MNKTKPKIEKWRVTFEAPAEWQAKIKSALALEGLSIREFLIKELAKKLK